MDEPSEQMRPLLRTVSTRLTQLTVRPPLHLQGSLSVFASCLPSSRGSTRDAWESDSVRHHPAAAIVSRLLLLTRGTRTSCVQVSFYSQRKLSFKHVFFIEMCFPARFLTVCFVFVCFQRVSYLLTLMNQPGMSGVKLVKVTLLTVTS